MDVNVVPPDSLDRGVEFLTKQDAIFMRNAWVYRWTGWICGWGAVVVAVLGASDPHGLGPNHNAAVWGGFMAAALAAVDKTIRCDVWADAYYRGHLVLEEVIGDHVLGKATREDLADAWHIAQSGMPGSSSSLGKKALPG
jgi:hypothetical protein